MDFKPTEEQELMVQAIEEAMTRENLETYFQDCDREHKHPKKWWDLLDELGLFSMFLPEEAGGDGEGAITMFLVMEALGRCGGPHLSLLGSREGRRPAGKWHQGAD